MYEVMWQVYRASRAFAVSQRVVAEVHGRLCICHVVRCCVTGERCSRQWTTGWEAHSKADQSHIAACSSPMRAHNLHCCITSCWGISRNMQRAGQQREHGHDCVPGQSPWRLCSFPVLTRVSKRETEEPRRSESQMLNGDSPDTPALQVQALRNGESVDKPIYNHVTGLLDPPEKTKSPHVGSPSMARSSRAAVCSFFVSAPCCQPPTAAAARPCADVVRLPVHQSVPACDTCLLAAAPATVSSAYDEPPNTPSRHTPALHSSSTRLHTAGCLVSRPPQSSALCTSAWRLPQPLITCL